MGILPLPRLTSWPRNLDSNEILSSLTDELGRAKAASVLIDRSVARQSFLFADRTDSVNPLPLPADDPDWDSRALLPAYQREMRTLSASCRSLGCA
jgi:hypothetical protein